MANRVQSKGPFQYFEAVAAVAITPGMLVKLDTNGKVTKHTQEAGVAGDENIFATEDALQGRSKATDYAIGDIVSCIIPNVGSEVHALIEDGQNLSISERVMSAGNGLIKSVDDIESGETLVKVIGVAVEARDLTGSNTVNTFSRIRIV